MRTALACGIAALLLAGCLGDGRQASGGDANPTGAVAATPFAFDCGPGTVERAPGVCVYRIRSAGNQLTEPAFAIHPKNPNTIVVAAHAVGTASVVSGGRLVMPMLFVSEDGGKSWRESVVPFAPLLDTPGDFYSDPALAFTPNGTLVFAGLRVSAGSVSHDAIVLAMTSTDLGMTWSSPQEFGQGHRNDREWLVVSPDGVIYLSWQEVDITTHVAWSADEGVTWTILSDRPPGCFTGSPVEFVGSEALMACQRPDQAGNPGVDVYRVDRASGSLALMSRIPDMHSIAPRILTGPGATVLVTGFYGQVARSGDAGRSWEPAKEIRELVTVEDDWPPGEVYVYWSAAERNALHLMLAHVHRAPQQNPSDEHPVAHVVLDATTLQPIQETRLTPQGPEAGGLDGPGGALPSLGDDWYQMAANDGEIRLVWTWAGGIDYAHATS